jgi:hypothetical protein
MAHVFHRLSGRKPSGSGIHIKPSHRGIFTRAARASGEGVQEHAQEVLHSSSASPAAKKQANFARMAKRHWKPL